VNLTKRKISGFFLMVGALLRGHGLPLPAVWYDEAYSIELTRLSLFQLVRTKYMHFNPPLWEMVLWPFARISEHPVMVRLPSLLASVGALYVFWMIMDELEFSGNQRLFASVLGGLLPGHFLIAQDARVYALLTLLYMVSILFAIRGKLWGLTAVSGLMLYAHTVAAVFAASAYLLAWYMNRDKLKEVVLSGLAALAAWLPWLPSLLNASGEFWLSSLTSDYFLLSSMQAVWAQSLPDNLLLLSFFILLFYSLVGAVITLSVLLPELFRVGAENFHQGRAAVKLFGAEKIAALLSPPDPPALRPEDKPIVPLGIVTIVPLGLMILESLVWHNIIFYRPLSIFLLPFTLWLGAAAAPLEIKWYKLVLPACLSLLVLAGLIGWNPAQKGGGLDLVAQRIEKELSPGDMVFYATGTAALPFEYHISVPHQAYIMDADQHNGLLQNDIQDIFGYGRTTLDQVKPEFIILPRDPIIEQNVIDHIEGYLETAVIIGRGKVDYWQASPIEIYHLEVK